MSDSPKATAPQATRRDFLKTAAVAGTALAANMAVLSNVHAAGSDTIKVGLVGCGGRGSGAVENVLHSAPNVEVVALGDVFKFKADGLRSHLLNNTQNDSRVRQLGNRVNLPADKVFAGLDAYKKVINSDANYIILATPPGFRPVMLEAAVAAGKNIFTEKPVGTDGAGIRKVLDAYDKAKQKGLHIVAGTQRRHQLGYVETMKRIHEGAIGDLTSLRAYWNQGRIWFRNRSDLKQHKIKDSDLAYQLYNWYHFVWICGDHICEQHVHNLDVCNWAMNSHPVKAVSSAGRETLTKGDPNVYGNIFDHFATDYEYPNGVHMQSMCRQIDGCVNNVSEALVGTKGTCRPGSYSINGKRVITRAQDRKAGNPYVQEHTDLINHIRKGEQINELKNVAESTLTAIMGRLAGYTGKEVTWSQALATKSLMPELDFNAHIETPPPAVPGQTSL